MEIILAFLLKLIFFQSITFCQVVCFALTEKIIIIGAPGTGKTTLARVLHNITKLPAVHLDSLFWKLGWIETPKAVWIAIQQELIQSEGWIIDGNYQSTLDIRLYAADVVIFLDMPRHIYIWGVIKRYFLSWRKPRPDLAKGCLQKITWSYLCKLWNFPARDRKLLIEKLHNISDKKQIIWLTSRVEVSTFIKDLQTAYEKI